MPIESLPRSKAATKTETKSKQQMRAWPESMKEQAQEVRAMASMWSAMTAKEIAARFTGAKIDRVVEVLDTLASLGATREVDAERFVAWRQRRIGMQVVRS
jgi:hypothetical protein